MLSPALVTMGLQAEPKDDWGPMMASDADTFEIVVERRPSEPDGTKSAWGAGGQAVIEQKLDDVRSALQGEVQKLQSVFDDLGSAAVSSYRCTEVELQLEFKAEGGFRLVSSASASVGATLTLRFTLDGRGE